MIVDAPASFAPITALRPSGPQPTIATVEADCTGASVGEVVAPSPATATQLHTIPTSAAVAFVKIGTTHSSLVIISSASPPMCELATTGVPSFISAITSRLLSERVLAHVRTAAQTLITAAALRRPRHADAIADLHAPHLRPDRFDDSHATVALDGAARHRTTATGRYSAGRRTSGGTAATSGRRRCLQRQDERHVRVAQVRGFGANNDLPAGNGTERQFLQRGAIGSGPPCDPATKAAGRHDRRRLTGW
jgi:hypothetical protein